MVVYQCLKCGYQFQAEQATSNPQCPQCGAVCTPVVPQQPYGQNQGFQNGPQPQYAYGPQMPPQPGPFDNGPSGKSRGVAGLLAILLGGFGAHYFYLNKIGGGFLCILLTAITCGIWSVLTLVQGIIFFTMQQDDFEQKFVYSKSTFPLF